MDENPETADGFLLKEKNTLVISLKENMFTEKENIFLKDNDFIVSFFCYQSGVHAVRIKNIRGEMTVLPFLGQQIWRAEFDNRPLQMKSMFKYPVYGKTYLKNYGAYLIHCGLTGMGNPGSGDTHELHGELPSAYYNHVYLFYKSNPVPAIGIGGTFHYREAFSCNYLFSPVLWLRNDSSIIEMEAVIENRRKSDFEYMYLTHINFNYIGNSRLFYSAPCKPDDIVIRDFVPSGKTLKPEYILLKEKIKNNPSLHHHILPDDPYDPEILLSLKYVPDEEGSAHSLLIHPDGYAFYVNHRPDEYTHAVRWITNTCDEKAIGLVLPCTAEPEGYKASKAKGTLEKLEPGEMRKYHCNFGILNPKEAEPVKELIQFTMDKEYT